MYVRQLGAAAFVALAACGTNEALAPLEPTGPIGRVRFVNLITDTTRGRVNAILERVPFGVNLTYAQSTPATLPAPATAFYAPVLTGDRTLVLKRTRDTSVTVATIGFTVNEGQDRTIYAIGGVGGSAVTSFVTADTNPVTAATETRLRVVQLSPTAGAVDVFVTAAGANLATATPVATALGYQSVSPYFTVPRGTYEIRLVRAGTAPANRAANVVLDVASVAFAGGTDRTILIADANEGGAPIQAVVLGDR